jgi:hypothetical protein
MELRGGSGWPTHYFYFSDQAFVIRQMREFLLGNLGN